MFGSLDSRVRTMALLLAGSALLSRLLGYGRDLLLNGLYGATEITDVYRASFAVPDMLNYLLAGGALTVSFLPRMTALYARTRHGAASTPAEAETAAEGAEQVDRVFSRVASFVLCLVTAGVVAAEVFTVPLVGLVVEGFDDAQVAATVRLTRIVLPAQIFFVVGGLWQAALLARQRFGALALTPLFYNGGIIVGGLAGASSGSIEGFSWGALFGAFTGALVVPLVVARGQVRFRFRLPLPDREVRIFLWTALPLMIGVSLTTVDEWCGVYFGSGMETGAISWLSSARRLVLVPVALVGTAAGQATGSFVARLHAEGRREELAQLLSGALRSVITLSVLITALAVAQAEAIVGLLFEHGHFVRGDTLRTAGAMLPLAFGITARTVHVVTARALYGAGDTWRPMLATTLVTAVTLPLYAALVSRGIEGLAMAGAVGMTVQALALCALARRRLALPLLPSGMALLRAAPVALLAGLAAAGADGLVLGALSVATGGAMEGYLARLVVGVCAWSLVVGVAGRALRLPGLPGLPKQRLPDRRS